MMAISPLGLATLMLASSCLAQACHPDNDDKPIATKKAHVATAAKTARRRAEPAGPDEDDGDDEPKASLPAPSGAAVPPSAPEIIDQPEPPSPTEADDDDADGDDQTDQPAAVIVAARRLDAARAGVNASLGASTYSFSNSLVEMRPGGETVPIGQVLLQAPGVAQTAPGQLQVRGDTTLQYRINNIIIPDGFTDLAESLSARTAQGLELVTGALPAQYGLQVGGIVNITTKSGVYEQGGQVELYGGSGEIEPAVEFATSIGGTNISMSGSYLQDDTGQTAPDGGASPLHDKTRQWDGFAYVDHALDDRSRISLILGGTAESFQLPNDTGLDAATATSARTGFQRPLSVNGVTHYRSEDRDAREDDSGLYGIVSYLWANDRLTFQASGFLHRSTYGLTSDGIGDLLFSGLSQQVRDKQTTAGLQIETSYKIGNDHTLRAGLVTSRSRQISAVSSTVLPVDPSGRQTTTAPVTLVDTATDTSSVASLFAQDEWTMTGTLTLNTGMRFDHAPGAGGGDQFSPRANLVWKASQNTTVHAGYARYFVPVLDDENAGRTPDLAGTTGAPPGPRGQDVKAETDDYLDIGVQRKTQALT
ncbi:MAG: TonB-dependent receptor, partial [Asticcacaulis sp.]|nr:TonB-dependent receptor [Asticcacaulis sp.]